MKLGVFPVMGLVAVLAALQGLVGCGDRAARPGPPPSVETVTWTVGDITFRGELWRPGEVRESSVGVVVYPEWWGLNEFVSDQGLQLAADAGVVVLVADLYGDGRTTDSAQEASELASSLYNDSDLWRVRAQAAIDALKSETGVTSIMVMGFCFGGSTALHMGYASPDVRRAVSFHGSLPVPRDDDPIGASILVLHGQADPLVSEEEIAAFVRAMNDRRVDWTMVHYGHAVHSFTNPDADGFGIPGVAFQREAAERSRAHMLDFLRELP